MEVADFRTSIDVEVSRLEMIFEFIILTIPFMDDILIEEVLLCRQHTV